MELGDDVNRTKKFWKVVLNKLSQKDERGENYMKRLYVESKLKDKLIKYKN